MLKQKKQLQSRPRRLSRRILIILSVPIVLLIILFGCTDVPGDIGLIQHFLTPPDHYTYHGHTDYVSAVAWSPDGKRIASASGDHTVQIWDATNGGNIYTYRGHSSDVLTLAWSPNGHYLATGSVDTTVQVWNASTGQQISIYRGHSDAIFAVAWSPDGARIASASNDGTMQVWTAITASHIFTFGSQIAVKGVPGPWNTAAWSPDGKRIAVGGNGDVRVLDADSGDNIANYGYHSGTVHEVAWSPDGLSLAFSLNTTVEVWNVSDVNHVYTFSAHSAEVFTIAWSPTGTALSSGPGYRIASGSGDGIVEVWDAFSGGHLYTYRGHADFYPGHLTAGAAVNSLAWSPNGKRIASASSDTTVQVWQAS